jgi:hypothetical protein
VPYARAGYAGSIPVIRSYSALYREIFRYLFWPRFSDGDSPVPHVPRRRLGPRFPPRPLSGWFAVEWRPAIRRDCWAWFWLRHPMPSAWTMRRVTLISVEMQEG